MDEDDYSDLLRSMLAEEENSEFLQRKLVEKEKSELEEMLEIAQGDIEESRSCNTQSPPMGGELPAPRVHGRVPDVLFNQNKGAYSPSCVSIGPLNSSWRDPEQMEAVKKSYMRELLERNGTLKATLKQCTEAMHKLKSRVKECYSQRYANHLDGIRDYVRYMLLDGCFIIELLYKKSVKMSDPILKDHLKYNKVRRDLLLLKNQIPFFVLEELFTLTVKPILDNVSLHRCVLSFFGDMMMGQIENIGGEIENLESNPPHHLLHFLHICYQHPPLQKKPMWYKHKEKPTFKYSVTELRRVGVKFGPRNRASLFDLKFSTDRPCFCLWGRAHFKIPRFSINEFTESVLRNLIAFEHCCPGIDNYFTSHAIAMSILLDSAEDVKLLEEAGVVRNKLGFSEAVSELFKDITSHEIIVRNQDLLYKDLWMQVMDFRTPWRLALANATTQMAVVAVIILNLITLLSSIYTVLSYYRY